jgi:rhodanese-related sulfurtransferase
MKKTQLALALLIILSLILGACTPTAPAAVAEVTQAPVVEVVPTQAPAPTEVPPAPEPELDFPALFQSLIATIPADQGYGTIKPANLNEELVDRPPFLLDVREPSEFAEGYIEGAVNIPVRELLKNLDKLPGLDEPIVVFCKSGHRGALAMAGLRLLGYTNVRNLAGGVAGWTKASLPVTTEAPADPAVLSTPIIADAAIFQALDEYFSTLPESFYATSTTALNEALAGGEALTILDVRQTSEFENDGRIAGAVNLPMDQVFTSLDQLPDQDAPIVVHCVSGHRAAVVTMGLGLAGYTNVLNLGGGLNAWKAGGFPVEGWVDWNVAGAELLAAMPADQGYWTIKPDVLNTALVEKPPFLVDLREANELEQHGYIEGAIHIPVRALLQNLDKLPGLDEAIVVYCGSGHRGAIATAALRLLGYTNVANLAGGIGAWTKAEFALVAGQPAPATPGTAPVVDATRLAALDTLLSGLPEGFYAVSAADLNVELAGDGAPVVVDVRTPEEFAEAHIEGAVNITASELFAHLDQIPDKAASIVVVCKSGHRAGMSMTALRLAGYTNVRNLGGGMNGWTGAELPVVQ